MAWISWSQTWATRRTTTTSRKPLRWSWKNLRWRRMYLLLRADQRPKQNHEDVLLPAHLQELCFSVKDLGLILSQELIRLSLTQCQIQTDYSSSSWSFNLVLEIEDYLRNDFVHSRHWSDEMWRQQGKYFNIVQIHQDKKFFISEAL